MAGLPFQTSKVRLQCLPRLFISSHPQPRLPISGSGGKSYIQRQRLPWTEGLNHSPSSHFPRVPYPSGSCDGWWGPARGRSAPAQSPQHHSASCSGQIQTVPLGSRTWVSAFVPTSHGVPLGSLRSSLRYRRWRCQGNLALHSDHP